MKILYRPNLYQLNYGQRPRILYVPGIPGPPGAGSGTGSARFVHTQSVASAQWTINHTLTDVSHVTFFDSTGHTFLAAWQEISPTQIQTIAFALPISGKAYLT